MFRPLQLNIYYGIIMQILLVYNLHYHQYVENIFYLGFLNIQFLMGSYPILINQVFSYRISLMNVYYLLEY